MQEHKIFRCPFEVKGEQEGTIITVSLSEEQPERFAMLRQAFERLHTDKTRIAIRLILPGSLQRSCSDLYELREQLLPYQAEVIAADLDDQLFPFLPHQDGSRELLVQAVKTLPFDELAAIRLREAFGKEPPKTIEDLAQWLLARFETNEGVTQFKSRRAWFRKLFTVISFSPSSLCIYGAEAYSTFGIVKTPFYPREFGRYSERVEIVITRHIDAARLPLELRERIRKEANEAYAAHGVSPEDLAIQQPTGLWIPGEKYKLVKYD